MIKKGKVSLTCKICGTSYIGQPLSSIRICGECEDKIFDWIKENRERLFRIIFSGDKE